MIRAIAADPDYRAMLTAQLQARSIDPALIEGLVAYARGRQATMAQAMTRKLLTDAGVSWEAV